jgi:hypothetical protein
MGNNSFFFCFAYKYIRAQKKPEENPQLIVDHEGMN